MAELFDNTFEIIGKVLDLCTLRHDLLSANIANAETPNYRAFDIVFKEKLRQKINSSKEKLPMLTTHRRHIALVSKDISEIKPTLVATPSFDPRLDGNKVDIEYQMSQLAQNSLEYQTIIQMLIKKIAILRYAINEGRR